MRNNLKDYTELWQLQDSITTAVNACGYGIWDLCPSNGGFRLELSTHIEEEDISNLCCQLPLMTDYEGEGRNIIAKTICTNFQNEMCIFPHFFAVCLPAWNII